MDGLLTPIIGLLIASGGFYFWWQDYQANRRDAASGDDSPADEAEVQPANRLPGAYPTTIMAVVVAVVISLILLGMETIAEIELGVSDEQSDMTMLFGLYTLAAAFIEELIFRGFLYYDKRGRGTLVASCVGFSLLFAVIHPYMWEYHADAPLLERITFDFSTIAILSTSFVFIKSLWYYFVRFFPLNPTQSLIPCIAAHFATNLGVFAIKAAQGHVVGWY